ncbi:FMN-binding negative transcriptional regulator [Candidatus Latescibacteria bacterium]|jgi:transcriptional regulator|nr:FMN-binding negative transcriptional regulator [Candidatus Latescibacterota bacterium]
MYIPTSFREEDEEVLAEFIARHSFATLVGRVDGAPYATHLPFVHEREQGLLIGHIARANPQWRDLQGEEALIVFQGPHAYISPSYYAADFAVPTWNYAAVHVYGVSRVVEDQTRLAAIVEQLTERYEGGRAKPWHVDWNDERYGKMLQAIVGIEVEITRVEGKFKLNQNRPEKDQLGVVVALTESADAEERALAGLMAAGMKAGDGARD